MICTPHWSPGPGVKSYYTDRLGGCSVAPYDSFNLALHVGDNPAHVALHRQQLPLAPRTFWLNQVHSNRVVEVTESQLLTTGLPDADASFTSLPNTVCAVMTADCLPVLVSDPSNGRVAAIHAGWRGLANGIIENTLSAMGCRDSARIWIGPAIGFQHFEVGEEVVDAFPSAQAHCFAALGNQKWLADLPEIAYQKLRELGGFCVSLSHLCSFANRERFFSYRRDGQTGRMVSGIWVDPDQ